MGTGNMGQGSKEQGGSTRARAGVQGGGGQAGAKTFVFVWGGVRRTVWCVCMGTSDADVAGGPRQGGATQSSDGKYTRGGGRGGEAARDVSKKLLEAHL